MGLRLPFRRDPTGNHELSRYQSVPGGNMPRHESQSSRRAPDPVEVLLGRALRLALSGSLLTGPGPFPAHASGLRPGQPPTYLPIRIREVITMEEISRQELNRDESLCIGRRPEGLLSEG